MQRPFPAYNGVDPFIFVSYAHEDAAMVYPELIFLKEQGYNIWYDEGISPGSRWSDALASSLEDSALLLFFCSPQSVKSRHCVNEVNLSLNSDKPTLAVHLEPTKLTPGLQLQLSSHQAILMHELDHAEYKTKLVQGISPFITSASQGQVAAPVVEHQSAVPKFLMAAGTLVIAAIALFALWPEPEQVAVDPQQMQDARIETMESVVNVSENVPGFSNRAAIAVLPFSNMSNDPSQDYFAHGITEDLYIGLMSFQSFPIIATSSTYGFANSDSNIREIASALGVGYLIKGSVRKGEEFVRINVQLLNEEGHQLWADRYDFALADTFEVQDELIRQVLLEIEPQLVITEAVRARRVRTEEMEAWDYYVQAVPKTFAPFAFTSLTGQQVTLEDIEEAKVLLHKAIDIDPNFPAAYRLLNHVYATNGFQMRQHVTDEEAEESIRKALEYGAIAQQLNPFEPSVCSCQAAVLVMTGDVKAARRLQEEGVRENPSNAVVRMMMAKILQVEGEYAQALKEMAIAKRLSPRDIVMTQYLQIEASIYLGLGNLEKSIELSEKSLLLYPANHEATFTKILSLVALGDLPTARAEIDELHERTPDNFKPVSGWMEPFPLSVASRFTLTNGKDLSSMTMRQGLAEVFGQLGWQEKTGVN